MALGHSFGTPDPLPRAVVIWEFKARMAAPIIQMWYVKSPGSDIPTAQQSPTSWRNPVMSSWLMWSVGSLCRSRISRMKKKSFFRDRLWIFLIVAPLSMELHISCTAAKATGSPPSKESESEDDGSLASVLGLSGSFSFLLFIFFRTDLSLSSGEVAPRVFIM